MAVYGGIWRKGPSRLYWKPRRLGPVAEIHGTAGFTVPIGVAMSVAATTQATIAVTLPIGITATASAEIRAVASLTLPLTIAMAGTTAGGRTAAIAFTVPLTFGSPSPYRGWQVTLRGGYRWQARVLGDPMSLLFPRDIAPGNDLTLPFDQVRGVDPLTHVVGLYPNGTVQGWLAAVAASDTALGGVGPKGFTVSNGAFVWFFDASEVDQALAALVAPVDGQTLLYAVAKGTGEFRVAVPLRYRAARVA